MHKHHINRTVTVKAYHNKSLKAETQVFTGIGSATVPESQSGHHSRQGPANSTFQPHLALVM